MSLLRVNNVITQLISTPSANAVSMLTEAAEDGFQADEIAAVREHLDALRLTPEQLQALSYAMTPAPATAVSAGADLPDAIDTRLAGLPVTSYAVPETAFAPMPPSVPGAVRRRIVDWRSPETIGNDAEHQMGLRVIRVPRANPSATLASITQTGDIVLSVRPEWAGGGTYTSLQMGISHAGMIVRRNGRVHNIDQPLTSEYIGDLNASHYRETSMLHIIRPRGMTAAQQRNLREWVRLIESRLSSVHAGLPFNGDYSKPNFVPGQPLTFVENLARLAVGLPTSEPVDMFCSEFVWSLLALRDIDPNSPASRAGRFTDIHPIVTPADMFGTAPRDGRETGTAGLSDGPMLAADVASGGDAARRDALLVEASTAHPLPDGAMSAGHTASAAALNAVFPNLGDYYVHRDDSDPTVRATEDAIMNGANAGVMDNYSPAYYFTNALLGEDNPNRVFDYVGTVIFE